MFKHAVVIPLSREHAGELRDCGETQGANLVVDRESDCYKAWLAAHPRPSRGLGDTIAKATQWIGIKPCGGCKKRQARLNELVPYRAD
jgi:hypothetical protein